jgi:hypothetical protein
MDAEPIGAGAPKPILEEQQVAVEGSRTAGNADRIVWNIGISPPNQRLRIELNETDMGGQGGFAPSQAGDLADKYGINRGRFFVRDSLAIWYFALNTERPLFRDNPNLRKAVNHAMDRRFLAAQDGYLAGARTDQILPPGMPGFRDANIYSLRGPNVPLARRLARGNTRGGKAIYYGFTPGWVRALPRRSSSASGRSRSNLRSSCSIPTPCTRKQARAASRSTSCRRGGPRTTRTRPAS